MHGSFPTLLVSRRPRRIGADWYGARSWLGGAPRLGATPWPRDKAGEPLHFAAQIDLAEIAHATGGRAPLPAEGSLAFFFGKEAAVIFVPAVRDTAAVYPPADTPELTKFGGSAQWPCDLDGRSLYPYWPMRFSMLNPAPVSGDIGGDEDDNRVEEIRTAQVEAVTRLLPRRETNLSPQQAFAGPPIPVWWQTAIHYSGFLEQALGDLPNLIARTHGSLDYARNQVEATQSKTPKELKEARDYVAILEERIATLRRLEPAFRAFAAEVSELGAGHDPWSIMTPGEQAQFNSLSARNHEFTAFHFNHSKFTVDFLGEQMFRALPAAGTAEFAALPVAVRSLIAEKRAPRPLWWHLAIAFARALGEAVRSGVPRASRAERDKLEVDRLLLGALRPNGALAGLRRLVDGRGKQAQAAEIEARIAATEAALAARRPAEMDFERFVDETAAWVAGRDPWALMAVDEIERLNAAMARSRDEFGDFTRYIVASRIEDLETATLRAMLTGPDQAYAALPDSVRDMVNRDYLLPSGVWHQMFGVGEEIQGNSCAMREEGYIMLLQLTYDDLMHWSFGDNGVYQFWIAPDALRRQDWSAVKMTFECH